MEYVITPFTEPQEQFYYWENAFNSDELDHLEHLAKKSKEVAQVGSHTEAVTRDIRKSKISWMKYTAENDWVFKKLSHVVSSINANNFRFDITGFGEGLQLTLYEGSDNGMYNWHRDYGGIISRKLSLVLQLTDPSRFEGGNLEILDVMNPITIRKQRGLITLFPSYITHRVTPVTSGERASLVAWVSGPSFK
jgi:PKHD-type hydroxylase